MSKYRENQALVKTQLDTLIRSAQDNLRNQKKRVPLELQMELADLAHKAFELGKKEGSRVKSVEELLEYMQEEWVLTDEELAELEN